MWTVTKIDGTSTIDSAVFTEGVYSLTTKTIDVYTTEFSKAATYEMVVKVFYAELPTIFNKQNFEIVVKNLCLTDTFSISNSIFMSPVFTYTIGDAA